MPLGTLASTTREKGPPWHYFTVIIGDCKIASFRYKKESSKDLARQKAIEEVWKLIGPDCDPWPYIKEL